MPRIPQGRMLYSRDGGPRNGFAIFLEAQATELRWTLALSSRPEDEQELERLREDGHRITRGRKSWQIESPGEAVRATQLYRTLLHEIGHHVARLEHASSLDAFGEETADERFFARPRIEREAAAHRYADEWGVRLRADRTIPFAPRAKTELRDEGIDPVWFWAES